MKYFIYVNVKHIVNIISIIGIIKITTPPGLYILGFIYSEGIKILTRSSSTGGGGGGHLTCFNDNVLRSINLIGGVVILPRILQQFHNGWSKNSKNQFLEY